MSDLYTKDIPLQAAEVPYSIAKAFVQKNHYSKVMPRITKLSVGGFVEAELVAVATLGWGVRPLHTIRKAFPSLLPKDYFEIGKLCVDDIMPRNTESRFISQLIKFVRANLLAVKVLYSWADGIIGKPGYVYQASNFFYGGFIKTEMYLDARGNRVHPRTMQGISDGPRSSRGLASRAYDVTSKLGYTKYFGYQFRYVYPLCSSREWSQLLRESPFLWIRGDYPKEQDCKWEVQTALGKREPCAIPPFVGTEYVQR